MPLIWQPLFDSPTGPLSRPCSLLQALAYVRIPRLTSKLHMAQYKSVSPVNSSLPIPSTHLHTRTRACTYTFVPSRFSLPIFLHPAKFLSPPTFSPFPFAIPIPRVLIASINMSCLIYTSIFSVLLSVNGGVKGGVNSDV